MGAPPHPPAYTKLALGSAFLEANAIVSPAAPPHTCSFMASPVGAIVRAFLKPATPFPSRQRLCARDQHHKQRASSWAESIITPWGVSQSTRGAAGYEREHHHRGTPAHAHSSLRGRRTPRCVARPDPRAPEHTAPHPRGSQASGSCLSRPPARTGPHTAARSRAHALPAAWARRRETSTSWV